MKPSILLVLLALLTSAQVGRADNLPPLNVKYLLRGYCYAGSRADKAALGGYGGALLAMAVIEWRLRFGGHRAHRGSVAHWPKSQPPKQSFATERHSQSASLTLGTRSGNSTPRTLLPLIASLPLS